MRWATELLANILVEDELLPNHYAISVDFDCETEDICLQNIGFERIKFFFEDMLEHVIICNKNSKFLKAFGKLNTNLMLLPGDPNDQLVLWCMYHKLSSILENNFIVDGMKLDSCQGDSIEYYYDGSLVDIEEI